MKAGDQPCAGEMHIESITNRTVCTRSVAKPRCAQRLALIALASGCGVIPCFAQGEPTSGQGAGVVLERKRVTVTGVGLPADYVKSIANIAEGAYDHYTSAFAMDMPDRLIVEASMAPSNRVGLFVKDDQTLVLSYRRASDLEPPRRSGNDSIYGLTFAIADIARFRTLGAAPWLSDTHARGLSHYLAADAMERLYVAHGKRLWAGYDNYVESGWRQLREDVKRRNAGPVIRAAADWVEFTKSFGNSALGNTLRAWRKAAPPTVRPEDTLRQALLNETRGSHEQAKRKRWFRGFATRAIWSAHDRKRAQSRYHSGDLVRDTVCLQYDDSAGESCTAVPQGGHVVTFQTPADQWYLTQVRFHGGRYGHVPRTGKDFMIVIRDEKFQPVAMISKPYAYLRNGNPTWHKIDVPITPLPSRFVVSLEFASTESLGFRMSADTSSQGHSGQGGLKTGITPLKDSDWMMRVCIDRAERDNPLKWRPER